MTLEELQRIRDRVRMVAERIQPLLEPVEGLARRNAPAHLWLGVRVLFGDEWRVRAHPESVLRFVEWVGANPNADYHAWPETPELRADRFSERLF